MALQTSSPRCSLSVHYVKGSVLQRAPQAPTVESPRQFNSIRVRAAEGVSMKCGSSSSAVTNHKMM
jgi:hypothetical protein